MKTDDLDCSMLEASEAPLPRVPVHLKPPLPSYITVYDLIAVFILGFTSGFLAILSLILTEPF